MAGYEDLRDVDPNAYAEEARNWQTAADGIRDRGTDLEQQIAKLATWQGASADAAKAKLSGYRKQYADTAAVMAQIDDCTRTDADTANALRRLTAQAAGLAPPDQTTVAAAATAIPPRTAASTDVKRWWDSLSPMQQESLLFTHAGEIGALDGVPVAVRDRANRAHQDLDRFQDGL